MKKEFQLIIIGGGPAGMSAALYAAKQNIDSLIITKEFGGVVFKKAGVIDNYLGFKKISPIDLIARFKEHLLDQEIQILEDTVTKLEKSNHFFEVETKKNGQFFAESVILATGSNPRKLRVKGEEKFLGKGVSYCVTCDGPLFKNKRVAVIGGGDAGCEAALFLVERGNEVFLFEKGEEIKAKEKTKEEILKNQKIKVFLKNEIKEIAGNNSVEKIIFQDEQGNKKELNVDGIFIEIGYLPAYDLAGDLVDVNERKEIIVDPFTFQTKTPGLFAIGDVVAGWYKQIAIAVGQGAQVGLCVYDYLKKRKN